MHFYFVYPKYQCLDILNAQFRLIQEVGPNKNAAGRGYLAIPTGLRGSFGASRANGPLG